MKKYFITCDLEETWLFWKLPQWVITKQLESIRSDIIHLVNNTLSSNSCEMISYSKIVDFFENRQRDDEFLISLDNSIYIKNADSYFDSNRLYSSKKSILEEKDNYKIRRRDWTLIESQVMNLYCLFQKSKKRKITLCDDWIFSWKTLWDVLSLLKKYSIDVSEVRTILNFSNSDNISWIPISSLYSDSDCHDWLDERDLFYGTNIWGASFLNDKWEINWLPYIDSREIAIKKATIPKNHANDFCKSMIDQNITYLKKIEEVTRDKVSLLSLPRISYLSDSYSDKFLLDILSKKKEEFIF